MYSIVIKLCEVEHLRDADEIISFIEISWFIKC